MRAASEDYFNNKVVFNINTNLDSQDYKLIIAFFKSNCTNGEEIISYEYSKASNKIVINYLKGSTKREILRRKHFKCKSYSFEACEMKVPKDGHHVNYDRYDRVLMVEKKKTNKMNDTVDDLQKHISTVVESNSIETIVKSAIYDNVMFLKYKYDLNFETIKQNALYNFNLKDEGIRLYEVFETESILVKIDSCNVNEDYLNKHFKLKKYMYWQVPFDLSDSPFIIVKFKDVDFKLKFLDKHLKSKYKEYFIENNFNLLFLNSYLSHVNDNNNNNKNKSKEIASNDKKPVASRKRKIPAPEE